MDDSDKPSLGFVQRKLPWIAAAAGLLFYLVTLDHWVRLDSLPVVAKITGWDWTPTLYAPLHYLLTYPFRWLPQGIQLVALNGLSAVLAAVTLGLLVRSVSLLPYDRTREARIRERSEGSLLSIRLAWVGPAFAGLICALQLSFWEHATSATGEMLDLLLLAYVIRCLLEFRLDGRESWLLRMAFVYGLAVTNNYAMIAFFPCCLFALAWIKGLGFFNLGFIGRMLGCGVAGLLPYLVLPIAAVASGTDSDVGFWGYLGSVLASQKAALLAFPPWIVLLLSLTSLLPVLLMGVRWAVAEGDTSRAGVVMAAFITWFMHVVMLAATLSLFFEPIWAPRSLGYGLALLPFYYLAALAAGYYVGYLLLVCQEPTGRARHRSSPGIRLLNRVTAGATLVVVAGTPFFMVYHNGPAIRQATSGRLRQYAESLVHSLPAGNSYVLSDNRTDLLLFEAALHQNGNQDQHVLLASRLMPYKMYHQELTKRYGSRWPYGPLLESAGAMIETPSLTRLIEDLAQSNKVFYLHPSMGYYFEAVEEVPMGMVYHLVPRPTNSLKPQVFSASEVSANEQFWEAHLAVLDQLPPLDQAASADLRFVDASYSRDLVFWGTALQRQGETQKARRWLELALRLNPRNIVARNNLAFNDDLRAGKIPTLDAPLPDFLKDERRGWDQLLLEDGPVDGPQLAYRLGLIYVRGALFRQALTEFQRVRALLPNDPQAQLWEGSMEAMVRFGLGDVATAESQALDLHKRYPKDDNVLETLTQIYLHTNRFTNALATVDEQLQLDPNNARALLNKAAICIQLKDYERAIPPLNTLLAQQPENSAALMNRAIANLQSGKLQDAGRDYEALRNLMPQYYAVYYGLGEVAYRQKDKATALREYEMYLKYGDKTSDEYKQVEKRVRELKGGA